MNIKAIGGAIKSTAIRTGYAARDHAPQILTYTAIASSTFAVGSAIYTTIKKLPKIQEDFNLAVDRIQAEISDPVDSALVQLEEIGEDMIMMIFDPSSDGAPDIDSKRQRITDLETVYNSGRQLEAAAVTKEKLIRVGKITLAYLPTILCLAGSIVCSFAGMKISTKRLFAAGATITALTTELATTRKDLKTAIGEPAMVERDRAALAAVNESSEEDPLSADSRRKMLYTKVYDKHLLVGSDIAECVRMAEIQLKNYETQQNHKLERSHILFDDNIGRAYYGDLLRALAFQTDECGQNTGWISRDYPSEYDGYIDFGCWLIDPTTGAKHLNPENIDADGRILLNFNVEGYIPTLLKEAKANSSFLSL